MDDKKKLYEEPCLVSLQEIAGGNESCMTGGMGDPGGCECGCGGEPGCSGCPVAEEDL